MEPHTHRCPRYSTATSCTAACSAAAHKVGDTFLEPGSKDNPVFICEVYHRTTSWTGGAADEYPSCCSECWPAFNTESKA